MNPNSSYRNFFVPREVNLDSPQFRQRLKKLEHTLSQTHTIEVIPNGWKCTPKKENKPGYVVTVDSVLFVMKQLGI